MYSQKDYHRWFEVLLAAGFWGDQKKATLSRPGVSQVLNRLTYASTLSDFRQLNSPVGRDGKLAKPR